MNGGVLMSKKMKKLMAGVLITGSILGMSVTCYARPVCPRCHEGTIYYDKKCNDYHCTSCGCLAQY